MIYLDNSATTRPFDSVIDTMDQTMRECYFNASAAYKPAVDADPRNPHLPAKHRIPAWYTGKRHYFYRRRHRKR